MQRKKSTQLQWQFFRLFQLLHWGPVFIVRAQLNTNITSLMSDTSILKSWQKLPVDVILNLLKWNRPPSSCHKRKGRHNPNHPVLDSIQKDPQKSKGCMLCSVCAFKPSNHVRDYPFSGELPQRRCFRWWGFRLFQDQIFWLSKNQLFCALGLIFVHLFYINSTGTSSYHRHIWAAVLIWVVHGQHITTFLINTDVYSEVW